MTLCETCGCRICPQEESVKCYIPRRDVLKTEGYIRKPRKAKRNYERIRGKGDVS